MNTMSREQEQYEGDARTLEQSSSRKKHDPREDREGLLDVMKEMVAELTKDGRSRRSMLLGSREVVQQKAPRLKQAAKQSSEDLVRWINQGGQWRSFLITVTGLIALLGLTGVAAFLVFFVIATTNTIVVALLGSMAAVGACVAVFFAALTAIYIGALSIAVFVISSIAFMTMFAVVTAASWIAFWWASWQLVTKVFDVARGSIALTASSLQGATAKGHTKIAVIDGQPHVLNAL
ncbi:hypothetical protein AXG93_4666s1060 [Marchantia polymorpha subsp. ruderalis]|nr:hypothetical protein AXG93_4666s1060 [Marchantia polymorpha subsp. ruderalis]